MRIAQVRALIVVGVLVLIAVSTSWYAIANDSQTATGREDCEPGDVPVDLTLPEEKDVSVKLLNATDNPGIADTAAEALEEYGFNVIEIANSKKKEDELESAVEIHYGPKVMAGGHLMRAYFYSDTDVFELENDKDYVEVILGPGFQQVNTKSDARLSLPEISRPQAPKGTCAIQ